MNEKDNKTEEKAPKKKKTGKEATQFRSGSKAEESGRKGGIKSGESRRHKKELKECLEMLLSREMLTDSGETVSGAEAISIKQFEKALMGDTKAFEVIRDTAGQKPVEKIQVAEIDQQVVSEVERIFDDDKK